MIETWREIIVEAPAFYVAWIGLLIGFVFGFIVQRTNFCTMGSLSDIMSFGDFRRFRSWMLAVAVAMIGVAVLQWVGVADMANSMYLSPNFGWLGNIVGGLLFGFGMVYGGGCVSKNIVRAGSGDMRSLINLIVIGLFAYITIGGLLGPARVALFSPSTINLGDKGYETQGMGELLASVTGMGAATGTMVVLLVFVAALIIYAFKDAGFRSSPSHLVAGFGIGLLVVAGWMLTGLAQDDFADAPVALISLSYVRPSGDTLDYMMRYSALGLPGFGVVTLVGALLGALVASVLSGGFRWSTFSDTSDTLRNLFGAALMGIGGVLALGCTVGQGLTGVSTLSAGSLIATVSIVAGGIAGIKSMEWLLTRD
jgi:hypothetical protein